MNSASVVPGNEPRMLTLATPAAVITSKSGCNARVEGEPVHAAGPKSSTRASPTADARDRFGSFLAAFRFVNIEL
jgi:hypothetical protein